MRSRGASKRKQFLIQIYARFHGTTIVGNKISQFNNYNRSASINLDALNYVSKKVKFWVSRKMQTYNDNLTLILNNHRFNPPYNTCEDLNVKIEYEVDMGTLDSDLRIFSTDQAVIKEVTKKLQPNPTKTLNLREKAVKPFGDKIHEYKDVEYYLCNFNTRNFAPFNKKLQKLLEFFIDGVVEIEEDVRWSMVLVYSIKDGYELIGYCSFYHFYNYPESIRVRISQFIIFPPYNGQGHGKNLYEFLMARFARDDSIVDVTVEDPNDLFQDMRDTIDCRMLMKNPKIKTLLPNMVTKEWVLEFKKEYKLCMRQLVRMIEVCVLKNIPSWDARSVKEYRLWVKKRIYNKNRDVLEEMEFGERVSKLQETFDLVEKDYIAILGRI